MLPLAHGGSAMGGEDFRRRSVEKGFPMMISERVRSIREGKHLSQAEVEKRCGLRRCYISRVENGHTIPSVETLERLARAMNVPLYHFFYDGDEPPSPPSLPPGANPGGQVWGFDGPSVRYMLRLRQLLSRIGEHDRKLLLHLAAQLVRRTKS
jgi:transcriptional regulator with XRE-family HTH domain